MSGVLQSVSVSRCTSGACFGNKASLSGTCKLVRHFSRSLSLFIFAKSGNTSGRTRGALGGGLSGCVTRLGDSVCGRSLSRANNGCHGLCFSCSGMFRNIKLGRRLRMRVGSYSLPSGGLVFCPTSGQIVGSVIATFLRDVKRRRLVDACKLKDFRARYVGPQGAVYSGISELMGLSCGRSTTTLLTGRVHSICSLSTLCRGRRCGSCLRSRSFLSTVCQIAVRSKLGGGSHSRLSLTSTPVFGSTRTIVTLPRITATCAASLGGLAFSGDGVPPVNGTIRTLGGLRRVLVHFRTCHAGGRGRRRPWDCVNYSSLRALLCATVLPPWSNNVTPNHSWSKLSHPQRSTKLPSKYNRD